ncbi:MAG: ABC transporter [Gemmataceae bacterium]
MRSFYRVIRYTWPYRRRLIVSVLCAALVALLWGANLMAIYPVLKILGSNQNLQKWIDEQIHAKEQDIERYLKVLDAREQEIQQVEKWPAGRNRERRLAELTRLMAKDEGHLTQARQLLHWYQTARLYIYKFCPEDPFETLVWIVIFVLGAVTLKGLFDFLQEALVGKVVNLALFDLRNALYRNVIHLDPAQFDEEGSHQLMARFTNDMEALGSGLKTLFGKMVAEPLKVACCVLLACMISWRLTLLFLLLVPAAFFVMNKVGHTMKKASRKVLESMSSLYKILQETFQAIRIVKAFTMERYERCRFFQAAKDYYRKGVCMVYLEALAGPTTELLGMLAVAGSLLVGAYLVINEQTHIWGLRMTSERMEPEALLQLYALLAAIADPVRKLSNVYGRLQSGSAAADRVFAYMDLTPRIRTRPGAPHLPRHHRSIEFRDVCFSYVAGQPVLSHIQLEVRFGEAIALVGPNGSGKSTLIGLLARFYDPQHGAILIDGVDIRHVHLGSLRRQIGLVTQETILFDDTIYNNISYGHRHARPEEVEEAARRAHAHDFIVRLKDGYQTRIGEMGHALSGGQRQRLALARAILRNPTIFILDEATSAADVESEALIHKVLRDFTRQRTTFLISHRLSTLELADRIVLLDGGRIQAVGTHDELLRQCPTYAKLFEIQVQRSCA